MKLFRADLHIHTVLSPCASLEMSPKKIIEEALKKGINMIAVTDHNITLNVEPTFMLGKKNHITVIPGTEICSNEEVHSLAFFPDIDALRKFQEYLNSVYSNILNTDHTFGYQLVVDQEENIISEIDILLSNSLTTSLKEVEKKIHEYDGLFVPSHINRPSNSVLSQLGFIPDDLEIDALEIAKPFNEEFIDKYYDYTIIKNSDAHTIEQIGMTYNSMLMESCKFSELKKALEMSEGREVII